MLHLHISLRTGHIFGAQWLHVVGACRMGQDKAQGAPSTSVSTVGGSLGGTSGEFLEM